MKRKLVTFCSEILNLLAFANVACASGPLGYQPEVPEELR